MRNATLPGLALYLALNMPIVGAFTWFLLTKGGKDDSDISSLWILLGSAFIVLVSQFPLLLAARNWLLKILIFYGGMLAFLLLGGYLLCMRTGGWTWQNAVKAVPLTLIFAGVGHALGIVAFPIILMVNWLARKWLFGAG